MKYQSHLALDEVDLPPTAEWDAPTPCWCFVLVAKGQGYWLGQGEPREVSQGDVLVLPPLRRGNFRASQLSEVHLHHFRFCPELMSELLTMSERHFFDRLAARSPQPIRFVPASHALAAQFADLCAKAASHNGLLLRCQMLEMVGKVFARELAPVTQTDAATLSATKRIRVLLEHLTEEEFLAASSAELAAYCGCSLRHFSRLFLQHFGVSLRSRQTEMRLLKARRLLAETDSRVMTVAAACSYRHLGVFNALFKKRFGMTPSEWRREAILKQSQQTGWCSGNVSSLTQKNGRKPPPGNGDVVTET
jgi:AraC-like DNA-binding protein